ncbi:MAG: LysR family transcriptional regulator [Nakamurella sp.]
MNDPDQQERRTHYENDVSALTPQKRRTQKHRAAPQLKPQTEPIRVRDLDTRLLLAFRAVAVEGTFGRAASRMGYTQSAVSQQIAALEAVIGATLFERHGGPKPVTLTPLGGVLLERVHELLGVLEAIATDVSNYRSGDLGRIDVGTIQSISTALLPTILRRLRAERPGLDMRLEEHYEETELVEGLTSGNLDVTFLVNGNAPTIKRIDVLTDPFVVLARAEDAGPGPVSIQRLAAGPLIGQIASTFQDELDDTLRAAGCEPDYVFRSADNGVVISMVRAGLGLAILPRLALLDELDDPRLAIRTLDPPIPARVIRLAWRRDRVLSPAAERFRLIAIEVAAELGHRHPVLAP